jgi:hypothetical protein
MNKYLEILPDSILSKGFPLNWDLGGYAFYAPEILEISKILVQYNIAVLGGAVLVKINNVAEYSANGENWYLNYIKGDNYDNYVINSNKKMTDYIKRLSEKFPDFLYQADVIDKIELEKK